MTPRAEIVHWLFATGFLLLGLLLLAEAIVGRDVWRLRPWRTYLWPALALSTGYVAVFSAAAWVLLSRRDVA